MQTPSERHALPPSPYDWYDAAALLLLAMLIVLVFVTYGSYGISNDEPVQQRYGELIIAYYTSGFADRRVFALDNLYLYGGLFDVTATLLAKLLPLDLYSIRHILCALIGVGGIAATWATARLMAGSRAGLIAAALLTATGAWYGAIFNHTKDVTFGAAMMAATYWLLRSSREMPSPRLRDVLLFGVMLGAALGLRAMGLLLGIYLAVATLMQLHTAGLGSNRERLLFIGRTILAFVPGLIVGYLIMIAAWPWAALDFFNPVRAVVAFSEFNYEINDLFAGGVYRMDQMPRWYLPTYLAIRLPLILLCGAAVALVAAVKPRLLPPAMTPQLRREIGLLAFMVAFPVAAQIIGHGPIFSGMRHFTFVVPPMAALAGIGLHASIAALALWRAAAAMAAAAVVAVALLWNASILVRLHPNEYLFYNSLVGGLPGAAGRYATDYWSNSLPEALAKLESFLTRMEREQGWPAGHHYKVSACTNPEQLQHILPDRLSWVERYEEADFVIATTHMACDKYANGDVIATVERLGVVIAVIKDHRALKEPEPGPS
jgi:hypothetical protein